MLERTIQFGSRTSRYRRNKILVFSNISPSKKRAIPLLSIRKRCTSYTNCVIDDLFAAIASQSANPLRASIAPSSAALRSRPPERDRPKRSRKRRSSPGCLLNPLGGSQRAKGGCGARVRQEITQTLESTFSAV